MSTATEPIAGSRYLETGAEIANLFRVLRDQRTEVTVQVSEREGPYTARVLDIVDDAYLLDDVRPRTGHRDLDAGTSFSLTGRTSGLYLFVSDNRIRAAKSERGVPYYEIPLPERVLYQSRGFRGGIRQSLRVTVADGRLWLYRSAEETTGRIVDISAGGCRVDLETPVRTDLAVDDVIESCRIRISTVLEVHAEAIVRFISPSKRRNVVSCGLEFQKMHVTDRRRLEHFIQAVVGSAANARPAGSVLA